MFFPGETITHRFVIPFSKADIDYVVISYKQNEQIMLEKTITSDLILKDTETTCVIEYDLSQTESLSFDDDLPFSMQLNVYSLNGTRHTSYELKESNGIQYFREVMQHG